MTYEERQKQASEIAEKKARGEKITQDESRLLNLSKGMIKAGEVRNPNGRGKGSIGWSTRIRRLMEDEKLLKSVIKELPSSWQGIVEETPADVIAAALIVSVARDSASAVTTGSSIDEKTLRAIDRISKIGYGDKITLDAEEGGFFDKTKIVFNVTSENKNQTSNS